MGGEEAPQVIPGDGRKDLDRRQRVPAVGVAFEMPHHALPHGHGLGVATLSAQIGHLLLLGHLEHFGVEARPRKHLPQNPEPCLPVRRHHGELDGCFFQPDVHTHFDGVVIQKHGQLDRRAALGPAPDDRAIQKVGQARLGILQIDRAGFDVNRHVDERQFVVRQEKHLGPSDRHLNGFGVIDTVRVAGKGQGMLPPGRGRIHRVVLK